MPNGWLIIGFNNHIPSTEIQVIIQSHCYRHRCIGFLYWSIEILREKNPKAPIYTFKYSITYLMLLFIVMLVDHYLLPITPYTGFVAP